MVWTAKFTGLSLSAGFDGYGVRRYTSVNKCYLILCHKHLTLLFLNLFATGQNCILCGLSSPTAVFAAGYVQHPFQQPFSFFQ